MSETIPARTISEILKKAGLTVGARYMQTGYVDRAGRKFEGVRFMVTREGKSRYSGRQDRGYVLVAAMSNNNSGPGRAACTNAADKARAALREAGYTVAGTGSAFKVNDPV